MKTVDIILPVYNEEDVLPELLKRVLCVLDRTPGGPHEVVFVDDGSSDQSCPLLLRAARHDIRIKVVMLSRNFGHQAALQGRQVSLVDRANERGMVPRRLDQ